MDAWAEFYLSHMFMMTVNTVLTAFFTWLTVGIFLQWGIIAAIALFLCFVGIVLWVAWMELND